MSEPRGNKPISAELVAQKLERVKNFESKDVAAELEARPRFREMLWFLQWVSNSDNYPGGIARFSADLIDESEAMIGTINMQKIGPVKHYTPAQLKILAGDEEDCNFDILGEPREKRKIKHYAERFEDCKRQAKRELADYLFGLCENPFSKFTNPTGLSSYYQSVQQAPEYFPRVGEAILAFMDRRKTRIAATIGETAITREISKWLEISRSAKRTVLIIGTERFGKTESVKNWCLQNPGIVRLVQTPSSAAESDLLREVANTLGIESTIATRGYKLRQLIDYVLAHSGLMLVFDECQFLLPGSYSKTPAAPRLNWFRRSIMDKGIPAALVATPQSYKPSKDRFVKKTGYAIGQFDERILKTVNLSNELCREDLLSIAKIHFPDLAAPYLEYVVENTLATQRNYVSDIEKIAALSRVCADQAGRKIPSLADIKSAIADVLPTAAAEAIEEQPASEQQKRDAAPMKPPCTAPAKRRGSVPAEAPFSSHNRTQTPAELAG